MVNLAWYFYKPNNNIARTTLIDSFHFFSEQKIFSYVHVVKTLFFFTEKSKWKKNYASDKESHWRRIVGEWKHYIKMSTWKHVK